MYRAALCILSGDGGDDYAHMMMIMFYVITLLCIDNVAIHFCSIFLVGSRIFFL